MFIVQCPHCHGSVEIEQLNCRIFRHGVFIQTGQQIPPHAPRSCCEVWAGQGVIFGCGKPFQIVNNEAIPCDYI